MPTPDRLAAPPTVVPATQADDGAQIYWLWCQPCHGDRGQGLTDEWREQYPQDHQNCWASGCHGDLPYEDGFTLPQHVPAIIGAQTLARFQTMDDLFDYVHTRMPFEFPGALSEEEALAVTAYLARSNDKWDGTRLTKENVGQHRLQPESAVSPVQPEVDVKNGNDGRQVHIGGLSRTNEALILIGGVLFGLIILIGIFSWRRRI